MTDNPLLEIWGTPFGIPPFNTISDHHFSAAFDTALDAGRNTIEAIATQSKKPTFDNTIGALEQADQKLDQVANVFFNLSAADSNKERRSVETECAPILARYASEIFMNPRLFKRIETLWNKKDILNLSSEQQRVLDLYYRDFVRAGAKLSTDTRHRFKSIKEQLALLQTQFSQNLLADEANWYMPIDTHALTDLPEFLLKAMKQAAIDRNLKGHIVTLNRSLIVPFLKYCPDRHLRKQTFLAWCNRGANKNSNNNLDIVTQILELRYEIASLLGYKNFAEYKLEIEMAQSPSTVRNLLNIVWSPAHDQFKFDAEILQNLMEEDGVNARLKPWDWRFYSERRRVIEHNFSETDVKQYFNLEHMIEGVFDCANKLFHLDFSTIDIPLYHPDCLAWEVTRNGEHIAVFIGDYFARPSKRSGAWSSSFRSQSKYPNSVRPLVVNVCNFTKPAVGEPCQLSFDDVRTLFHEFGHALHSMLSDVTYERISGTSVARDFVELPSQLFEHWMEQPEVLKLHARHAITNTSIPDDLLEKLLAARNYDQGFATMEYLASALVDLEFHDNIPPEDPMKRQAEILAGIKLPVQVCMRHATPNFAHVFASDGYSAGYYSYIWSEMLDADAFQAFLEEGGPFNPKTSQRLMNTILSAGGSRKPEDLYRDFRGKLPDERPLLQKRGFLPN